MSRVPFDFLGEETTARSRRKKRNRFPEDRDFWKQVVLLVIGALIGALVSHVNLAPHYVADIYDDFSGSVSVPGLNLASVVPSQDRVTFDQQFIMGTKYDPVQVVGFISQQRPGNLANGDIVVFSWDPAATRWTKIFDVYEEASANYLNGYKPAENDRVPLDIQALTLPSFEAGREDLAVSANMRGAASPASQEVEVTHFANGSAQDAYQYVDPGPGSIGTIEVRGRQSLEIDTAYYTTTDALCCPVRNANFVVAPAGSYSYKAVADDRPWTGAYVVQDALAPGSPISILTTEPNTLASLDFNSGEEIVGLPNSRPSKQENATNSV